MAVFHSDAGVLLHPSSLPGRFCIGEIGPDALRWLDTLHQMGQSLWQLLPLNPPGHGSSPYQSASSFAGDTRLISLEALWQKGLLQRHELAAFPRCSAKRAAFDVVYQSKRPLLLRAAERWLASGAERDAFDAYCRGHADWLDDYACFVVLSEAMPGRSWASWPRDIARRDPDALAAVRQQHRAEMRRVQALQYLFDEQWAELRRAAAELGIRIIGDIPIFVAYDSADVWCHPELFKLDDTGAPTVVAGVPPDYFSATGQRWGNPVYDWEVHQADGYAWWMARLERALQHADVVRVDHFRGFAAHWEIPSDEPTAIAGQWVTGPGDDFFRAVQARFGQEMPIVAEDLGLITDDVVALKDRFQLPGMRVLQFSFGGRAADRPDHYPALSVAYTGTHDNDTMLGWFTGDMSGLGDDERAGVIAERQRLAEFFNLDADDRTEVSGLNWTCIRGLMETAAEAVIVRLQDILGQGSESRMNTPGTVGDHNWGYRFDWNDLTDDAIVRMHDIAHRYRRGRFRS